MLTEESGQALSPAPRACRGRACGACERIRPKFPEDVETHACCEGIATYPQGGRKPASVARMVGVVETDSGRSSQPLQNIEHVLAAVALRYKGVFDCMDEPPPAAAVNQAVVSGVLREDRWIREIYEEPPR